MPTNRQRIKRSRVSEPVSETVYFLLTGELSPDATDRFLNNRRDEHQTLWENAKGTVLERFIKQHPGCRPWAWWRFDSPEPRQRVGGTGSPSYECMGFAPAFSFGLPTSWPSVVNVELELCKKSDVPDPDDPPVYESQAAYLQRHGLLTSAEIKWLTKHPAALQPEPIRIIDI